MSVVQLKQVPEKTWSGLMSRVSDRFGNLVPGFEPPPLNLKTNFIVCGENWTRSGYTSEIGAPEPEGQPELVFVSVYKNFREVFLLHQVLYFGEA